MVSYALHVRGETQRRIAKRFWKFATKNLEKNPILLDDLTEKVASVAVSSTEQVAVGSSDVSSSIESGTTDSTRSLAASMNSRSTPEILVGDRNSTHSALSVNHDSTPESQMASVTNTEDSRAASMGTKVTRDLSKSNPQVTSTIGFGQDVVQYLPSNYTGTSELDMIRAILQYMPKDHPKYRCLVLMDKLIADGSIKVQNSKVKFSLKVAGSMSDVPDIKRGIQNLGINTDKMEFRPGDDIPPPVNIADALRKYPHKREQIRGIMKQYDLSNDQRLEMVRKLLI